jgi:hypothetical protein
MRSGRQRSPPDTCADHAVERGDAPSVIAAWRKLAERQRAGKAQDVAPTASVLRAKRPVRTKVSITTYLRAEQWDDVDLMSSATGMSKATLYQAALDLFLQAVERRPILDVVNEIEARRACGTQNAASATDEAV